MTIVEYVTSKLVNAFMLRRLAVGSRATGTPTRAAVSIAVVLAALFAATASVASHLDVGLLRTNQSLVSDALSLCPVAVQRYGDESKYTICFRK